jgi:uncharacterized protein YceK
LKLIKAAVVVIIAVSLSGCSAATTPTAAKPAPAVASSVPMQVVPSAVGATLTVHTQTGQAVSITLLKVDPKAVSLQSQDDATAGNRYYAAQLRYTNPGKVTYTAITANNGASLTDTQGQQYTLNPSGQINALSSGPQLQASLNIPAGGSITGWLLFVVPTSAHIVQVQIAGDMGLTDAGTWKVA